MKLQRIIVSFLFFFFKFLKISAVFLYETKVKLYELGKYINMVEIVQDALFYVCTTPNTIYHLGKELSRIQKITHLYIF